MKAFFVIDAEKPFGEVVNKHACMYVLFIMLYKVVHKLVDETHSNEIYWAVLSGSTAYYTVQGGFKSVDETLVCDHSNESYWAVLSCGSVHCAVQAMCCTLISNESSLVVALSRL